MIYKNRLEDILTKYKTRLQDHMNIPHVARRCDIHSVDISQEDIQRHLLWMMNEIATTGMPEDKTVRWLCWMQGSMHGLRILSIQEARIDNYRLFNNTEPSNG